MSRQLWPSRIRPALRRIFRKVGPPVGTWLGFTLSGGLGNEVVWWTFGKSMSPIWIPAIAGGIGFLFWAGFALLARRKERSRSRILRAWALTFGVMFGLTVGLHFVRYPPRRFAFMGDHPMIFATEPTFPVYTESIYTFPANPERLIAQAKGELAAQRYEVEERDHRLEASRPFVDEENGWSVVDSVSIRPGRATGKVFQIDGDVVTVRPDPGWVTVIVDGPELLPFWLRMFLP